MPPVRNMRSANETTSSPYNPRFTDSFVDWLLLRTAPAPVVVAPGGRPVPLAEVVEVKLWKYCTPTDVLGVHTRHHVAHRERAVAEQRDAACVLEIGARRAGQRIDDQAALGVLVRWVADVAVGVADRDGDVGLGGKLSAEVRAQVH